jgi:hypothetical protein
MARFGAGFGAKLGAYALTRGAWLKRHLHRSTSFCAFVTQRTSLAVQGTSRVYGKSTSSSCLDSDSWEIEEIVADAGKPARIPMS